jgi:hypothetical protein
MRAAMGPTSSLVAAKSRIVSAARRGRRLAKEKA